jgi:cytochrome oxidase assembly protein ShyY1
VREALRARFWPVHLLAVVLTLATVVLGVWQLDAWQSRREAEARDLTQTAAVPLDDVMGPDDPFPGQSVGQPVDLDGTWLSEGTLFVSGREHDGQDGYWMLTPLAVGGGDAPAVPVVLGWVADPADAPAPPTGRADLVGWLQPPDGTGQVDDDPSDDVLPQLRIADVIQRVDRDLYGAYAVAQGGVDGLPQADLAQLPEAGRFTALRNLLYGIEWFVFGAFVVLMWWRWLGEQLAPSRRTDDDGDGDGGDGEPADEESPDTVDA